MSSSAIRPGASSFALMGEIVTAERLLPGLAYTAARRQFMLSVNTPGTPSLAQIAKFYLDAAAKEPLNRDTAFRIASAILVQQGDDPELVTHLHNALLLGALETWFRDDLIVAWVNDIPVLGMSERQEADFMAFYRYLGDCIGADQPTVSSSVELRTKYDEYLLELSRTGKIVDQTGVKLFWDTVTEGEFADELTVGTYAQVMAILENGMYPEHAAVFRAGIPSAD